MTFLNATLLVGLLAAAIPVALHLIGRREPKRVTFPAVRFLRERFEVNRRRLQVRRWVLLAMRVALFGLIALALAHPQIHRAAVGMWMGVGGMAAFGVVLVALGLVALVTARPAGLRWGLLGAGAALLVGALAWGTTVIAGGPRPVHSEAAPAAVAILVDNGPTSAYQARGEVTRLDQAQEMAAWILAQYPSDSRFAVLDRSARPATFALDASAAGRGAQALRTLESTRPMAERIDAAVRLLRTSQLPRKTLFILSDLTRSGWFGEQEAAESTTLAALLADEPEVAVQVVDLGDSDYRNRFLGAVEIADPTPPRQVPTTLSITVGEDQGTEAGASSRNAPVTVRLRLYESAPGLPAQRDGEILLPPLRTVDRQSVSIDSGGGRVALTIPPLDPGSYLGRVELVDADPLAIDNVRYVTVRVSTPRPILIVADDQREQEILGTILNPQGIRDARREYDIDFARMQSLRDQSLGSYAAIGIFNPTLPPPAVRDQIEAAVREGGKVIVALGPALDPDGIGSPVQWPLVGNPKRIWRITEPGTFLQLTRPSHPSLSALASVPGGAPWNAFRVRNYWQLAEVQPWSELMRYAGTEHIALGERVLDAGRVMVMTTPLPAMVSPANEWNDLLALSRTNAWPVVIPLLQQVFEDLSGGMDAELNIQVGQPAALPIPTDASTRYQLFAPDQPPVPLDAADGMIVPGTPRSSGNYWLRGAAGEQFGFSANLPAEATRLQRVEPDQLDGLFGEDAYALVRNQEEIQLAEGESSDARPLYPMLMLMVAGLFCLEQVLANRFYSASRAKSAAGARSSGANPPVAAA